jgi:general secretion pathway protein D
LILRFSTPTTRGGFAAFALATLLAFAGLARAQTLPPPVPAVLNAISVNSAGDEIQLTFTPVAPKFSVVKNDSDSTAVGFALSSRAPSALAPAKLGNQLREISFEQADTVLIIKIRSALAVHLTAAASGTRTITIKLAGPGPAERSKDQTADQTQGPLPKYMQPKEGEDNFEVVPLKYADVSEVVGLLTNGQTIKSNDTFTPNEPDFGSAGMGGTTAYAPQPPPNPEAQNEPLGQSVDEAIGVDRRLNAIILKGPPDLIARLKEKIAEIDVPVKSVILETVFVELTDTGAKNVGLDFNNAASQIGVATFQTGQFIPAGLPTEHPLTSASLQGAIYAQVQAGRGRIVSKPRIAAQSGSEAKIITGDALPILTSIALSGVNGVSQQVQYVNVGVTLQIAPRVSDDGFVTSHVFCVVSSVTGYSQGYPTISQRKAETSVTVRDGEAFVIGGLTQENDMSNDSKVPWLGDVPLLGNLFQLHKGNNSKTELYIVVTPHIVHGVAAASVTHIGEQAPPQQPANPDAAAGGG